MASVVTKGDMLKAVAEAAGITRAQAEKAVNALLDNMANELKNGHEVRLAGFGVFKSSFRAARRSVAPNGSVGMTRDVTSVRFRPYEALKQYG